MSGRRICIIGAGPSGMSTLGHFVGLGAADDVVCFEKQATWGGLWNFNWKTGVDEHGEPVNASMYKYMWTITAKETMEYPDYTYEGHFGRPTPSFAPRQIIRDYVEAKWSKRADGKLKDYIKFNTAVRYVKYEDETKKFIVTVEDLAKKETREEVFTHVIVASGIYSFPNVPQFKGIESFSGQVVHSHDFRSARHFIGQRILVIGAAYSGEDISAQLLKFGAQAVTLAYRRIPKSASCNIPNSIVEKPMVEHFESNTAHFKDGSSVEIDAVIFATGYRNHFPFLESRLRIDDETHPYPAGLYNGALFHKEGHNNLFYIGVLEQFHTFTYFEALAYWTCRFILGELQLEPVSQEEMQKSADKWHELANECKTEHDFVRFQARVIKHLVEAADYPHPEICRMEPLLLEWVDVRQGHLSLTTFRDHFYRSVYTGNMAPPPQIPFMENMDDSVEAYLGKQ